VINNNGTVDRGDFFWQSIDLTRDAVLLSRGIHPVAEGQTAPLLENWELGYFALRLYRRSSRNAQKIFPTGENAELDWDSFYALMTNDKTVWIKAINKVSKEQQKDRAKFERFLLNAFTLNDLDASNTLNLDEFKLFFYSFLFREEKYLMKLEINRDQL